MNTAPIGVVVPVYNRATTVLPTLDSIAGQTLLPAQLVVVDDGSHDGSAESVERWIASRRPPFRVCVVRKRNGGAASARNRGLAELVDCPWVAFLDSDDRWPGDFLARGTAAIEAQANVVAASADRLFVDAASGESTPYDLTELATGPALWMLSHGAAILSCSVLRMDIVCELGGFPESIRAGEDSALLLPLSLRGTWLHLPGQPVTFQRFTRTAGGEERAFSRKYKDNHRLWARVYDDFFSSLSKQQMRRIGPPKAIRRQLSDRWLQAGQELAGHGLLAEAARCYARSLRWRWTKWSHWRLLARTQWTALTTRRRAA